MQKISTQKASSLHVQLYALQLRRFAGVGDDISKPKTYKNVFNKRVSRDGKYVFWTVFPHDYNEPWPFSPVYHPVTGKDLNQDPVWGNQGEAPPSSITGKPRRALGHYPWLGRPIVPLTDATRYFHDDQVAPYPYFRSGKYEKNKTFWWQWLASFSVLCGIWWYMDSYYRGTVSLSMQRDQLWYRNHMCNNFMQYMPKGANYYSNPLSPINEFMPEKERWTISNDYVEWRFDAVFVPGAPEDSFAGESTRYFVMDPPKHPSLWNVDRKEYGVADPTMH